MSDEDAAADLLSSHGMGSGVAAVTQNNLKVLESKAKATLSTPGKPCSNQYDWLRGTWIAAHASTSGPGGDSRARFDAVAFEDVVQSLSGDSREDTRALLRTLYSVVCRMFTGKQSPTATEMLNRTGALASGFAAYVARRIVESDVCGAGPQLDAVLSETTVRSFLNCDLFLDFKSLCAPLAKLEMRPYDEFERLAARGGIPSLEAIVRMFEACDELYEDLGYKGWKEFCGNLLTILGINDKAHQALADMYARFVSQELRNVREQVRSGFDSTTLDNKVHVSFGCAPALQTLNDSKAALASVAQQVIFGLITFKRAQAAPAAAPPRPRPAGPASSPRRRPRRRRPPLGAARQTPPEGGRALPADCRSSRSRRTAARSSPPCSSTTRPTSRKPTPAR
jgi:hypothetical protein